MKTFTYNYFIYKIESYYIDSYSYGSKNNNIESILKKIKSHSIYLEKKYYLDKTTFYKFCYGAIILMITNKTFINRNKDFLEELLLQIEKTIKNIPKI